MSNQTHSGGVYNINYHIVWCPRFRRPVLTGDVPERLQALLHGKVAELSGTVVALEIQPEHVHLFVQMPPKRAPAQSAFQTKGYTSHVLRQEFPFLRHRLPSLWSRSYHVGTAGNVSTETIRRYIEAQQGGRQ